MPDQRTIAHKTGISLGMTNLIIQRLIERGYIKARQLNRKKIQYILTPEGFAEKARKSYAFTLKTVNHLRTIKHILHEVIEAGIRDGYTTFSFSGNSEVNELAELIAMRLKSKNIQFRFDKETNINADSSSLIMESTDNRKNEIDLMTYLSEQGIA